VRLAADPDLGEVIVRRWTETHLRFETCLSENIREIAAEFGVHKISPVTAGMSNCDVLIVRKLSFVSAKARGGYQLAPFGKRSPPERELDMRQEWNRKDVKTARLQDPIDLVKGGRQIRDMLKCF
jgi:hypothetical protein